MLTNLVSVQHVLFHLALLHVEFHGQHSEYVLVAGVQARSFGFSLLL